MCRMIAFYAEEPLAIEPLLRDLVRQSREGRRAPHEHGFGIVTLNGPGSRVVLHDARPIFSPAVDLAPVLGVSATSGILHSRKASQVSRIHLRYQHPFLYQAPDGRHVYFCQNGTIEDFSNLLHPETLLPIDSQVYFSLIVDRLQRGFAPAEAIEGAVGEIAETCAPETVKSLNCILLDGAIPYVYKGQIHKRDRDYHTLYSIRLRQPRALVVSTEMILDLGPEEQWLEWEDDSVRSLRDLL